MKRSANIKKLVSILLSVVFGLLIINRAVYIHSHTLDNGLTYTHAHPFQDSGSEDPVNPVNPGHSHTGNEYVLLDQVFNLLVLIVSIFVILNVIRTAIRRFIPEAFFSKLLSNHNYTLRGPPCVC